MVDPLLEQLLVLVQTNMRQDLDAVGAELTQLRGVFADAIQSLSSSFVGLDEKAQAQQALILGLMKSMSVEVAETTEDKPSILGIVSRTTSMLHALSVLLGKVSERGKESAARAGTIATEFEEMNRLLESVDKIYLQARVLAVNASIEAVRAGESGRGFAVVASEVRALSQYSKKINEEVAERMDAARTTIAEVYTIISDVAANDVQAGMAANTRIQDMLHQLAKVDRFIADELGRLTVLGSEVSESVATAIRSLQFEDMATQLINCTERRFNRLRGALSAIDDVLLHMRSPQSDQVAIADSLCQLQARYAGELRSPVGQNSMSQGSVELF